MGYFTSLRIKAYDFFKRNRKKIVVVLILWAVIIMIEHYLRNHQVVVIDPPSTTYSPFETVVDNGEKTEVPEQYQEPISNLIDQYFNYCNNGEYEKAYNLITEDCRKKNYPTLEEFTAYVNAIFEGKTKIYNIQSYSIVENKYIFNVRILDDILANGTSDGYYCYEEKFVLIEENGSFKLSIAEYIGEENPEIAVEDDNLKVEVENKTINYESETYKLRITNKTDNYVVIADNRMKDEVELYVSGYARKTINTQIVFFYLPPNSTRTFELEFTKFYDERAEDDKLVLNQVRLFKEYDWQTGTTQENLNNATAIYPIEIPLK